MRKASPSAMASRGARRWVGPLANPHRLAAMAELHQDAVGRGATVLTGGERGNF